jgi:serine/threonine protein kinase
MMDAGGLENNAKLQSKFNELAQPHEDGMRRKYSSNTLLSRKSMGKDIDGPITSSMFFKHNENRKLTDDYIIGKVIGQGAYGKVKLVTHRKSGFLRATKHIRKKSVQKDGEEQKLFEEVNILMRLDHPNIVRLFHLYEDRKNYIMVTEYCSGGELFERI